MKTTYIGMRQDGVATVYVARGKRLTPLPLYLDVVSHSPSGHEWGYGGSGPAQTAADILMHATGSNDIARFFHQDFKWAFIARQDRDNWRLPQTEVLDWVNSRDKCMWDRLNSITSLEVPLQTDDAGELVDLAEDYLDGQQTPP